MIRRRRDASPGERAKRPNRANPAARMQEIYAALEAQPGYQSETLTPHVTFELPVRSLGLATNREDGLVVQDLRAVARLGAELFGIVDVLWNKRGRSLGALAVTHFHAEGRAGLVDLAQTPRLLGNGPQVGVQPIMLGRTYQSGLDGRTSLAHAVVDATPGGDIGITDLGSDYGTDVVIPNASRDRGAFGDLLNSVHMWSVPSAVLREQLALRSMPYSGPTV